jgi:predicted CopG family antitoxin
VNVQITDETHSKLSRLKASLGESNLADLITSLIERCYADLESSSSTKIDLESSHNARPTGERRTEN